MLYHITNRQSGVVQDILVEANCTKYAEWYLLSQNPKARIQSIKEANPDELKSGILVFKVSDVEEAVMRNALLDSAIDVLDLSVRSYNCLRRSGVNTVRDLISMNEDDLFRIRSLGFKSINENIGSKKPEHLR